MESQQQSTQGRENHSIRHERNAKGTGYAQEEYIICNE